MTTDDEQSWDGEERRSSEHLSRIAKWEVDNFSIAVLDYNRFRPRKDQRTPGEILREVEERMASNKRRRSRVERWLGALLLSAVTVVMTAALTGFWPALSRWLGGH